MLKYGPFIAPGPIHIIEGKHRMNYSTTAQAGMQELNSVTVRDLSDDELIEFKEIIGNSPDRKIIEKEILRRWK